MSLNFVIDVIVFDVVPVLVIDVAADIVFDIEVTEFTAIIIDIHLLAAVHLINVIVVIVAVTSFVANDMIVDTGIVISICSITFFLFRCLQKVLLFLFFDKSIYSFMDI